MIHSLDFSEHEKNLITSGITALLEQTDCDEDSTITELIKLRNKINTYYTVSNTINNIEKNIRKRKTA